jgi:transcription-repair coupling factor (superfamily II helicase)
MVPKPSTARVAGQPLRDREMLAWCQDLVDVVLLDRDGAVAHQSS